MIEQARTNSELIKENALLKQRIRELEKSESERQQVEEALRKSEANYRQLFENSPTGIYQINFRTGKFSKANDAFCEYLGYSQEEITSLTPFDILSRESQKLLLERLNKMALGEKVPENQEYEIINKNGKRRWVQLNNKFIHDSEGIVGADVVAHDITDRKRAEETLQRAYDELEQRVVDRTKELLRINEELRTEITERKQVEEALKKSEAKLFELNKLQELLLHPNSIEQKLKLVTDSVVRIVDADFARVWMIKPGDRCQAGCIHTQMEEGPHICQVRDRCLHLMASSGRYTHTDGRDHSRVPFGAYKIGKVAAGEESKFLTNEVTIDPRVHNHIWAKELGLTSFAGYRLIDITGTRLGVLALFSKHVISAKEDMLLQGIADATSQVLQSARADEALQKSKNQYDTLAASIPVGVYLLRTTPIGGFSFEYVSPQMATMLGLSVESILTDPQIAFQPIHPEESEAFVRLNHEIIEARQPFLWEGRAVVTGTIKWLRIESRPELLDNGDVLWHGVVADITERKEMESDLAEKHQRLSSILDGSPISSFVIDSERRVTAWNMVNEFITGISKEEVLGKPLDLSPLFKDKTPTSLATLVLEMTDEEISKRYAHKGIRKSNIHPEAFESTGSIWIKGKEHIMAIQATRLRNAEGKVIGAIQCVEDITEQKRAEEALRESEELYRTALESSNDGVVIIQDGRYVYLNQRLMNTFDWKRDDMMGKAMGTTLMPPDDLATILDYYDKYQNGLPIPDHFEVRVSKSDGAIVYTEISPVEVTYKGEKSLLVYLRNITDRKRSEEALLRANKLDSLGILAGGIAHDFNNLMAIVQGYIDLALTKLPSDHDSNKFLQTAMQSVEQTKELTSRIITFSRGGDPHRKIFDITEIIRDAVYKIVKGTNVRVKFYFMENLWPAEVDEHQVKQCFYNLTTNAVEAMPEGGDLTIHMENALIAADEVLNLKEGSYLKITYTDGGIGIPEKHLSKIFDPYFTTKKIGARKGLGLGLSVCYSVVMNHGGHITVNSQPEKGTSFVLYLPAREDLAKKIEVKRTSSTGNGRILVMDDEFNIRVIMREYLEHLGYEVTDVKDGQEAIDIYKKALDSGNPFELVMLDLTIHQGLGGQLAMEQMLKINPAIKAIIASGYVDDPVIENYADYGFQGALTKPFKREEMECLVEKILHG
ncbi:MAG: PAS domain S-box protein [Syntrophaceae bacterium]